MHTYIGDPVVNLVAPDGSLHLLHDRAGWQHGQHRPDLHRELSGATANGTWELRVQDAASGDVGRIDTWPLTAGGGSPVVGVWSDTFETADGWAADPSATDTAATGAWQRRDPEATTSNGAKQLGTTVSGVNDLVTGRLAGAAAGDSDVDDGTTGIGLPAIALPATGTLTLSLSWCLAHGSNASSAGSFRISLVHNGVTTVLFTQAASAVNRSGAWAVGSWNISAYAGQFATILIQATDASTGSLVEAGRPRRDDHPAVGGGGGGG